MIERRCSESSLCKSALPRLPQAAPLEQARGLAAHVSLRCEQARLAMVERAGSYRRLFTWLLQVPLQSTLTTVRTVLPFLLRRRDTLEPLQRRAHTLVTGRRKSGALSGSEARLQGTRVTRPIYVKTDYCED